MQCVSRSVGKHIKWPVSCTTYRGSALPREFRNFFQPSTGWYRVPMYLATSADDEVATEFMQRLAPSGGNQQPPNPQQNADDDGSQQPSPSQTEKGNSSSGNTKKRIKPKPSPFKSGRYPKQK